ncbi:MAG: serine--tRNA ligase, partial [Candidatus Dormibacteraceae bacterium]
MLPLELVRADPERVKQSAALKGEAAPVDELVERDRVWREAQTRAERLRAEQNRLSKEFGRTKDVTLTPRMRELAAQVKERMAEAEGLQAEVQRLLLEIPNLFHESVPIGEDETDNVRVRTWGEEPVFAFPPRPHYDLGERLGILDAERAARVAGSRFWYLKGAGARLERALTLWMLDLHTGRHGHTEIAPPVLANSAAMTGTANLPKFAEDLFRIEGRDLWLIPTAEVPVTNLHRGEILEPGTLPLRYVAATPCFRSEAGSAGKDTRGYIRLHQFQKVEMVRFVEPERSLEELEALVHDAEEVLQALGLHYEVLSMCTGDMGFAQFKKYDINVWAPGLGRFLEVSSCSTFNDYQARRMNTRYRPEAGAAPRFVHTLNGSGLALPRTWDAVVETYQQEDG